MRLPLLILSFIFLLLNGSYYKEEIKNPQTLTFKSNPLISTDFSVLRDTIYTMKDHVVEVNLATHQATVRFRNGAIKQFPISGGNKNIEEGVDTKEGLFVLQWKSKKQYSTQFDSTLMLYWMGFNGGIGFHALATNGYYRYLGKKNVSHGCVRISRKDAEELYKILERGTPVLIHKGNSAITVSFGGSGEVYKYYPFDKLKNILSQRFTALYNGRYFLENKYKILIDEENVKSSGLPIGNADKIPSKQIITSDQIYLSKGSSEEDKLDIILSENSEKNFKLSLHPFLDSLYARR